MDSLYALYTTGSLGPKMLKAKYDRKDIKLLAAKKTTCIEVNTPSTNEDAKNAKNTMLRKWDQHL